MASKLYDYTQEELQKILDESYSYGDFLERVGMSAHGENRKTLRKIIDEKNLDISKLSENRKMFMEQQLNKLHSENSGVELQDILQNKVKCKTTKILELLIKEGLKNYQCEKCGISDWLGNPLTLQLHHKNGNHNDNSLDNLEVLCPNCHSQTDTFAGRNVKHKPPVVKKEDEGKPTRRGISEDGLRYYDGYGDYKELCPTCKKNFKHRNAQQCVICYKKEQKKPKISKENFAELLKENDYIFGKVGKILNRDKDTIRRWYQYYFGNNTKVIENRITREELKERIRKESFSKIGASYEVNGNTIKKWCKKYNLPFLKKDINNYSDEEWELI